MQQICRLNSLDNLIARKSDFVKVKGCCYEVSYSLVNFGPEKKKINFSSHCVFAMSNDKVAHYLAIVLVI